VESGINASYGCLHLVKEVQMGRVHVRNYEKGLVRAARLDLLRKGGTKEEAFTDVSMLSR
jgi:hypothetical protein